MVSFLWEPTSMLLTSTPDSMWMSAQTGIAMVFVYLYSSVFSPTYGKSALKAFSTDFFFDVHRRPYPNQVLMTRLEIQCILRESLLVYMYLVSDVCRSLRCLGSCVPDSVYMYM